MITAAHLSGRRPRERVMRPQTWALGGVLVILIFVWL